VRVRVRVRVRGRPVTGHYLDQTLFIFLAYYIPEVRALLSNYTLAWRLMRVHMRVRV
jgi:hypothetical protein